MKLSLLMLVSVALLSFPARAQVGVTDEPAPDLLAPSGAWLVGPTTLADGSDAEASGMPCVMVNKFSNGSELRFSGGGEEILALALNVGAPTFEVNQSYLITISFEGHTPINLPAEAFSENTVVVGTEPGKDFYKFLKEKTSMTLQLGTSVMEFSLLGVQHSLKRLEECYKPLPAAPAVAPAAPAPAPSAATGIKKLDEVTTQKVDELLGEITGNALPAAPVAPVRGAAPAVKAPEPAAAVSKSADVPAEEQVPPRPATPPQIQPAPAPLPEAVAAPEAAPAPAPTPTPTPTPQPSLKDAKPRDILSPPGTPAPVTGEGLQMRWRVMKGANLQSTLDVWADSTKGRLIWKADKAFSMPESMAMQGTFEDAVEAVLARFPRGQARPVGKIYTDPANGQKVLVIEQDSPVLPSSAEGSYAPIVSP